MNWRYGLGLFGFPLRAGWWRRGMFASPTLELLGLRVAPESHVTAKPDATFHEAAKAARLILAGNPTASELLWLSDDLYETCLRWATR